jgi:hypothetical protein
MTNPSQNVSSATPVWQTILAVGGAIVGLIIVGLKALALFGTLSSSFATFTINNAQFAEQQATDFRQFTPIAGNRVQAGQPFVLYFEPDSFTARFADGHLTSSMIIDLEVRNEAGNVIDSGKAVQTVNFKIAAPNSSYRMKNNYVSLPFNRLDYLPGKYTMRITLTERFSDEVASVDIPFEMIGSATAPRTTSAPPAARPTGRQPSNDQASTPRIVQ